MGFTRSTTVTNVHSTLGDYPAEDDHLNATQLKARFDSPATGLKSDLNGLMTELEASTSAASIGAANITADDTSDDNVQAKLEKIYEDLQAVALNDIPDNSITEAKLNSTYSGSLAKKDGTLQANLNAALLGGVAAADYARIANLGKIYLATQYRTPAITNATTTSWTVPILTSSSHTGYTATWEYYDKSSGFTDVYQMFRGDGSYYIRGDSSTGNPIKLTLQLPNLTKLTQISFKGSGSLNIIIEGSVNGTDYEEIGTITSSDSASTKTYAKGLAKAEFYTYIRLRSQGNSVTNRVYNNINLQGVTIGNTNNTMSITATETNEVLSSYVNGMIVKITTPSNFVVGKNLNPTLNIYSLGAKGVPNDLVASTRYTLVYTGAKFEHEN